MRGCGEDPTPSAACRPNVFESKMEPYKEYACALYKDEENPTITALLRDSQVTHVSSCTQCTGHV